MIILYTRERNRSRRDDGVTRYNTVYDNGARLEIEDGAVVQPKGSILTSVLVPFIFQQSRRSLKSLVSRAKRGKRATCAIL